MKNYTLLVGNYGASNIGDDMLLEASKQILNGENLKIMSPLGGDFPIFNSGFRSFLLKPWNNFLALDAIWKSNRVVFGGGGLLNSDNWRSLVIWGQILFWASMMHKNVSLLGQSFSSKPGWLLAFLLRQCRQITVRDSKSSQYLSQANIPHEKSKDLALELNQTQIERVMQASDITANWHEDEPKDGFILVNLREYRLLDQKIYENLIRMINELDANVVFVAFEQSDVDFFERYCRHSKMYLKKASADLFKRADVAIGMRLHFCITARKYGLKTLPLAYASKVAGLFEDAKVSYIDLQSLEQQKNPLREWVWNVK